MQVEINGVTYEQVKTGQQGTCTGCVAICNDDLCSVLGNNCFNTIWIKKEQTMQPQETQAQPEVTSAEEPKYTVEEVLEVINDIEGSNHWNFLLEIKAELAKKNNPDYKLYLELKAKFGE